jgi:hypothetical protein
VKGLYVLLIGCQLWSVFGALALRCAEHIVLLFHALYKTFSLSLTSLGDKKHNADFEMNLGTACTDISQQLKHKNRMVI